MATKTEFLVNLKALLSIRLDLLGTALLIVAIMLNNHGLNYLYMVIVAEIDIEERWKINLLIHQPIRMVGPVFLAVTVVLITVRALGREGVAPPLFFIASKCTVVWICCLFIVLFMDGLSNMAHWLLILDLTFWEMGLRDAMTHVTTSYFLGYDRRAVFLPTLLASLIATLLVVKGLRLVGYFRR